MWAVNGDGTPWPKGVAEWALTYRLSLRHQVFQWEGEPSQRQLWVGPFILGPFHRLGIRPLFEEEEKAEAFPWPC